MKAETEPLLCKSCGESVPPTARFCPSCGMRVSKLLDPVAGGEHRQITVMFCDLVGSTKLSTELHAEDFRELIREYQAVCAEAVESRGGMISTYIGDGILAYFGYPRASEDSAIHAADAGLEVARRVGSIGRKVKAERGLEFATRIALHTGLVLIGEMGAGETRNQHAITGVVPNIAARLEQAAPVNGLVVSNETRAMISSTFLVEALGPQQLKGIPETVEAYRVVGRTSLTSVLPHLSSPIEGRDIEIDALQGIWSRIQRGESIRAVIVGEPGVGKSVLAASFISKAGIERERVFELWGAATDRHTPFASLRRTIDRWIKATGIEDGDRQPIERVLRWFGEDSENARTHAETILSVWRGDNESGNEGRSAVFAACGALVRNLPKPMIIVVEDAYWVDPSTMEMLDRILSADPSYGMMLMLTRPGIDAQWRDTNEVKLDLGRLGSDACTRLIESIAGGKVESTLGRRIIDTTDGLPLYVEEFTKSLIDSGFARRERGVLRASDPGAPAATPTSLLDLITTRLDRLGGAKSLAQISSVLGRSFDRDALIEVSGEPLELIEKDIATLVDAEILSVQRNGRLSFRHALFQTAAYESLVRRTRSTWHERYLSWLQREPERLQATRPETLAYHLEASGRPRDAIDKYLEAGENANRASASLEAAAHFRKCADILSRIPHEDGLDELQLQVQVLLASALLSARGPGAPETRIAYEDAVRRAGETSESPWHFPAYWGWWRVSENFSIMADRARRLLRVSETMQGKEFKLQAKHCVWANAFQMGALDESITNAREGLALYEAGGFENLGTLYGGHDCKVCALGEIGLATWLQGDGQAAVAKIEAAIAHAENLGHLGSLLHALDIAVMLHHYRRDGDAASVVARRLVELGTKHDLDDYRAKGEIFLGWARIDAGDIESGLAQLNEGFRTMQEVGTPEDFPVYQCMRADAMRSTGDLDGATDALKEGRAIIAAEGVNYWGAEIARVAAETEMARPEPNSEFVAGSLADAIAVARSQYALALELRAVLSAFRWAEMSGGDAGARAALESVLARFDPLDEGRDLTDARAAIAGERDS